MGRTLAIDVNKARSRLELSQALIWVANLGKPNNTGTVDLLKVEKRLGTSFSMLSWIPRCLLC
jgi:hypothetical protein